MGTANDFATGLGIPEDPWEAMQLAAHDTARPIDIGTVNDEVQYRQLTVPHMACSQQSPDGTCVLGQAFINVATGGFGTELTVKTDEGLKDKLGGAAYFVTGTCKRSSCRGIQGMPDHDTCGLMLTCCCCRGACAPGHT